MANRGRLIAFEGGDGSGKSTQAKLLAQRIEGVLTRQAGGTPFGEHVRALTLDDSSAGISPRAEALLFMADRAEHVEALVGPLLEAGHDVVSDRWAYASLVYQGYGRGLDIEELRSLADWSMQGLWPDVVVLLEVSSNVGLARVRLDGEPDHFEAAGETLQDRVIDGYRELSAADPERWRIVDGNGTVEEVADRVWKAVAPVLNSEQ